VRFRIEQEFNRPLDAVEDALCDPTFVQRLAGLPKIGRVELLLHEVIGTTVHQQVRYAFAGELSGAVRRVVDPARLTWVEDSTTDRTTHRSSFRILPDNYANLLHCEGTFSLTSDGGDTSHRVAEGDLKVNVPLVGGKVERAILTGLEEHAAAEVDVVNSWGESPRGAG
jgi:hypothetical protein